MSAESFETSLCELMGYFYDNSYATRLCERIRRAHNREIRDVTKREFHRGFEYGQHSMDAEHRAIAMRLRALPLDGGSVENVFNIARAVYHNDFGWAANNCAALRDELVRLMGGVSDDTCDSQCRGACAADGCGCAGEQKEMSDGQNNTHRDGCYNNSQRSSVQGHSEEVEHGGAAHDCADDSRGGSGSELVHMDGLVGYDVLWNERQKAVCELRKMAIDSDYHGNYQRIALAIGTVYDGESFASECVRDRLIHLLGGDQPSGIDVLRAMDAESDVDGTCPNDVRTSSITDELREWMSTVLTSDDYAWAIADRIDEQFDRICKQQEAVLQSIIDEVVEERKSDRLRIEKLEKQRDRWRQEATDLMNRADAMEHERDELQAKLDAIRDALDG